MPLLVSCNLSASYQAVNLMGEDYELDVAALAREQGVAVAVSQVMKELEHIFSEEPEEELSFQQQANAAAPSWRM